MTDGLAARLNDEMEGLRSAGRFRSLRTFDPLHYGSNDYLGLSRHPAVVEAVEGALRRGVPLGATGSRLLSGQGPEHEQVEQEFARFMGRERALLFGSGYAANHALLSALPGRRDLVLLDAAAHASLKEGARAGFATRRSFAHNSVESLASALRDRERFRDVFIVVEGVYSMDGDMAPLRAIAALADQNGAHLIVDEAHATGLFGENLRGVHEMAGLDCPPLATVHPCGKALGAAGAFIAADGVVVDYLINTGRAFIFSTAPSPLLSVALGAALGLLPSMKPVAEQVLALSDLLRSTLAGLTRWTVAGDRTPIVPVVIGGDAETVAVAAALRSTGFDAPAVRPPSVPEGGARLRLSLTAEHMAENITELGRAIVRAEQEVEETV